MPPKVKQATYTALFSLLDRFTMPHFIIKVTSIVIIDLASYSENV